MKFNIESLRFEILVLRSAATGIRTKRPSAEAKVRHGLFFRKSAASPAKFFAVDPDELYENLFEDGGSVDGGVDADIGTTSEECSSDDSSSNRNDDDLYEDVPRRSDDRHVYEVCDDDNGDVCFDEGNRFLHEAS